MLVAREVLLARTHSDSVGISQVSDSVSRKMDNLCASLSNKSAQYLHAFEVSALVLVEPVRPAEHCYVVAVQQDLTGRRRA